MPVDRVTIFGVSHYCCIYTGTSTRPRAAMILSDSSISGLNTRRFHRKTPMVSPRTRAGRLHAAGREAAAVAYEVLGT